MTDPVRRRHDDDHDAVVVGGGHNGLVAAAYLARAGRDVGLVEARSQVGGTAASEVFSGARVNVCNCDHLTFRTTPIPDELKLADHGLEYLDVEPATHGRSWTSDATWTQHHNLELTLESLRRHVPDQVEGYRRFVHDARPVVDAVLSAATEPPTIASLARVAMQRRFSGLPRLLRWSRMSAAAVLSRYLSDDSVIAPALVTGPMVWGISPEIPGTGLGALALPMRHVGKVGRPRGGSGALTDALASAYEAAGGTLMLDSRVSTVDCDGDRVRGVTLDDGTELRAPVVVAACDPRRTFVDWLTTPPVGAERLVRRWRSMVDVDGYESKVDAVLRDAPVLQGETEPTGSTVVVAPSVSDMDRGARMIADGRVLERPAFMINTPSVLDPSTAPDGDHVFSLECLFTPYRLTGGWPGSPEPERWLHLAAELFEDGFLESIVDWRAMTPDVYEREFHLPAGHANSFAGGPLAALRNPAPELTRYETAVPGLYLTGAATFPGAGIWGASGRNCATVVLERSLRRRGRGGRG